MNERPILKTRTIMRQFKNNGELTLELMAQNYGMSFEDFLCSVKKVVGRENFSELQKLNSKRMKSGKAKPIIIPISEEDPEMKARIREDLRAQKEAIQQQIAIETFKEEENTMTKANDIEKLKEELQRVTSIVSACEGEIDALNALQFATKTQIEDLEAQLAELRAEEADQAVKLQEKEAQLENAKAETEQLQSELDKLTMVVLIAPRYKGGNRSSEMRMISSKGREGIEEEKVPEEDWVSKPTWESFVNSGHRDREQYEEDFAFVQLVLKYQCEGKKFELRANEQIKKMISFEGGEV